VSTAAGYSGTPLAKKLGYREGTCALLVSAPPGLPEGLAPLPPGVRFVSRIGGGVDLVHAFFTERSKLAAFLAATRTRLRADATLWISWPKKSTRVATDITEDALRAEALPLGFVDVKVCAVSDTWSGLKLVIRKELR
jgi:hypothetical protein